MDTMSTGAARERPDAAYVAPFLAFIAFLALQKLFPQAQGMLYPFGCAAVLATLYLVSRQVVPRHPARFFSSVALGIAVFWIWIGPDLIWPGFRNHWMFHNPLTGSAESSLAAGLKMNPIFAVVRVFGSVALVPILEELFWRGWLMRWLVSPHFSKVPLGTYTPFSFWAVAVLFASEHGSYWEVGLVAGIVYNWWLVYTRNLADCVLAHTVTNGCLAIYVLGWGRWQYWL